MFNNILGNDNIKELLTNAVKNNKTSHSYMFVGTDGIGKKMIAKEFAKMILCTDENKYCGTCKSCIEFDGENNPDFRIIEPDGNSLKIEQIREFQNKVSEKPIISNRKVYIINDSDKMTTEAQNCLLKTLEEPPEFVTSQIMLEAFQGSIGKAIQLQDKQEEYEQIENVIVNLEKRDKIDTLNGAEIIYKAKDEKFEILDYINIILLDMARKSGKYANCINIVEDTKKRLQSNANYDMCIDNMLLKLWEQIN